MRPPSPRPGNRNTVASASAEPGVRVTLFDVGPPAETPVGLLELLAWWQAKAGGELPDRGVIDPLEVRRHLPCIALLDVEDGDFRFRLAGEELQSRYGALRGQSVGASLLSKARAEVLAEHRACAVGRQPTLARRTEPMPNSAHQRRYWRLLLPFGKDEQTTTILAMVHFEKARRL